MKLPNRVISALYSYLKCSFTLSKLRFFALRWPKNPSCYTTSYKKSVSKNLLDTLFYFYLFHLLGFGCEYLDEVVENLLTLCLARNEYLIAAVGVVCPLGYALAYNLNLAFVA